MTRIAVVEFEDVCKDYGNGWLGRGRRRAVAGVSFSVAAGEVFGLIGPNRAGKTTLVKILLSLCRPSSGRACRFGRPVSERATLARVGCLHESPSLPRHLTAGGLLEFCGCLARVPYEEVRRRVPRLLDTVGLADRSREPISRFSKGMIQRLCVAQALINDPHLLVFDEPNEGLDLEGRSLMRDVIQRQRSRGHTVFLVSHLLADVEHVCDRVGMLQTGRLGYVGPVERLTHDPQTGAARTLERAVLDLYEMAVS
jgi:ABC-2 type transport system ATP-binding protein